MLDWHRLGYLRSPGWFSCAWTRDGERVASINVQAQRYAVTLKYQCGSYGEDWSDVEQRVAIAWTPCRFGGERPWFVCSVAANGVYCGRSVTMLYSAGRLFAAPCRPSGGSGIAPQNILAVVTKPERRYRVKQSAERPYPRPTVGEYSHRSLVQWANESDPPGSHRACAAPYDIDRTCQSRHSRYSDYGWWSLRGRAREVSCRRWRRSICR